MSGVRDVFYTVLFVVFIAMVVAIKMQAVRIDSLSARVETSEATIAALSTVRKGTEKVAVAKEKHKHEAQDAYTANPVWSDDVVPDDVADLLRDRSTR